MLHFLLVHEARADRPHESFAASRAQSEDEKDPTTVVALAIALNRSSDFECKGSGITAIEPLKTDSIAA